MSEHERVRPSADDIYESVKKDATEELRRPLPALAFSGLFAGATVAFGALAAAGAQAVAGHSGSHLIAALFYPLGFIAVILGRAQLFTENTLYPITIVLDEREHVRETLRLWVVVFAMNVIGAALFALLVVDGGAVGDRLIHALTTTGAHQAAGSFASHFWSGVMAGWLLALVAWLIEGADSSSGRLALIWGMTFVIAIARLDHCVSTTSQVLASVFNGHTTFGHFLAWLAAVMLGNVAGGVGIVGLINYGQVRAGQR